MQITFIDSICNPACPGTGGVSDINWALARELVAAGHWVTMIGPYEAAATNPIPAITMIALPHLVIRRNNIAKHMWSMLQLARAARKVPSTDIYHVPDSVTAAALAALGHGRRVVWHGHSNVLHHSQYDIPWDRSMYLLMRSATTFAAKRVGRVVALGPSLIPWWNRSGFSDDRICVVPNGVDVKHDTSPSLLWADPEAWQHKRYRLLYVGRLSAEKGGYLELIDAMADLSSDLSVGLVLIGDGPQRSMVEEVIQQRGLGAVVSCVGHQPVDVVQQAYRHADLVVLLSRGEMMPRVMLEAWASGIAFMGTAVGAIPDYLVDKENGYSLNSLEQSHVCSKIREALENATLRAQIAQRGRVTAQQLSWSHVATQFLDVYRSVIENTKR